MKNTLTIIFISMLVIFSSCDFGQNENPCDADQNGMLADGCARVINRIQDYESDGITFERMRLSFIKGSETADIYIAVDNGLIEEGNYSFATENTTIRFSLSSASITGSTKFDIEITNLERSVDGNKMSGNFCYQGTAESNFQSFMLERSGTFQDVLF